MLTLYGAGAVWHKCGTAKVNNPDMRSNRTGFYKNVLQLYVPVEHTPGVDPNECICKLFDDYLGGRIERRQIRYNIFTLFKEEKETAVAFSF